MCTEWYQTFREINLLVISFWIGFWYVKFFPKYLNSSTISKELFSMFVLLPCPMLCFRDMTMYLVLSAFTSTSRFSRKHFRKFVLYFSFLFLFSQPRLLRRAFKNFQVSVFKFLDIRNYAAWFDFHHSTSSKLSQQYFILIITFLLPQWNFTHILLILTIWCFHLYQSE